MGSGGTQWETNDTISVARMNQKTAYVGNPAPSTTYAGMLWYDTGVDILYERNNANTAWINITNKNYEAYRKIGTSQFESWFTSPTTGTAITNGALTANRLYAIPFIVPKGITLDRIGIKCNNATGGGNVRLGIYNNSDTIGAYPNALIIDAGTVSTTSTGVKTLTINQALTAGLYWLAVVCDSASNIACGAVASMISVLGTNNTLGTSPNFGLYVAFTYASLPSTFPSTPTMITAVPIPLIYVRLSA